MMHGMRVPARPLLHVEPPRVERAAFIKEGGYCLTRDGGRVGPMEWDGRMGAWRRVPWQRGTGDYWHPNGSRFGHCEDGLDLISEDMTR